MEIISGEQIQCSCDLFIGTADDFNYNPVIKRLKNKHLSLTSSTVPLIDKNVLRIFIYTHLLNDVVAKAHIKRLLQLFTDKELHLFMHNSDGVFTQDDYDLFDIKGVCCIYSQNIVCPLDRPTLYPLPIGQANSQWAHGNRAILLKHINSLPLEKTNHIYFNFNVRTNKQKRSVCYEAMIKQGIPNVPNLPYNEYLQLLKTYKFAICPEGNGPDTHRFWECIYLQVVPICIENTITKYFSKWYPIILVQSWDKKLI